MHNIKIIEAKKEQMNVFLQMLKELADFEGMLNEVKCDEKELCKSFFEDKFATPLFIEYDNKIVGYIIYYFTFSSFLGSGGLYLEDLYVKQEYRNKGCGKKAFEYLIQICKEKNLKRIEWVCLRGNDNAIDFYEKKLGAEDVSKVWHLYRLSKKDIDTITLS